MNPDGHQGGPGRIGQGNGSAQPRANAPERLEAGIADAAAVDVGFKAAGVFDEEEKRERRVTGGEVDADAVPVPGVLLIRALFVEVDGLPAGVGGLRVGPGEVVALAIKPAIVEGRDGWGKAVKLDGLGRARRRRSWSSRGWLGDDGA